MEDKKMGAHGGAKRENRDNIKGNKNKHTNGSDSY